MKYVTGLVVGKFYPLHKGHEYLIRTALEQCERLILLSYTSMGMTGYGANIRAGWLCGVLNEQDISRVEIRVIDHLVHRGVLDDSNDDNHRQFCAEYLLNTLGTTVQAVFTSESYGAGFAEFLTTYFSSNLPTSVTVDHIMVDQSRTIVPVSGTELRTSLALGQYELARQMLSPHVQHSLVRKVLFLGGESTGKTSIVTALANYFNTSPVLEFGRELYDRRGGKLQYEDMAYIGSSQLALEDIQSQNLDISEYLFCDTSPLTTMFYSKQWFGRVSEKLVDLVWESDNRYYKVFVCAPDFPMIQDGTRQDEQFRQLGHAHYLRELEGAGTTYTILTGSLSDRLNTVLAELGK